VATEEAVVIAECYIADEMIAAGVEAKREAEIMCLTEGEIVREIYYAMYGQALKCHHFGEESQH
jgi:hypothetical protein